MKPHSEIVFETDIVQDLISSPKTLFSSPYLEGKNEGFDAELGLYPEDLIAYIKTTQPEEYEKLIKKQGGIEKANEHLLREISRYMDANGSIHSLRQKVEFVGSKFELVQFQPDNLSNQKIKDRYDTNVLRVVRQVRYSPYRQEMLDKTGHGSGILDLVIFLNGIPVATLELKTDFTQSLQSAIHQYKKDRLPLNPVTRKPEPLLAFNKRCLVHFAVSTEEVYMTTKLDGDNTRFLPFNKGNGYGAGNASNPKGHASSYLWEEVLEKETLLRILGRFVHLQIKDTKGIKLKPEQYSIIFPRYHQLDVVKKLITTAWSEGPGHNYLIQHSADSGKSNSIWLAHQLASLTIQEGSKQGERLFRNVIVITDRTVLDSQLQDTIYQFDHQIGVVNRISNEEGLGSKSQQLAKALIGNSPIIIVTIQTFPFILEAIQKETPLKDHTFAVIADEAHSSQTGKTAFKLKEVLQAELKDGEEFDAEEILRLSIESRKKSKNISYFAFTATPKSSTLEIFGRLKYPEKPKSKENTPVAFHVYTMQQAIEEGYILDILKNYTTYDVAYKIANYSRDAEVDVQKARSKINTWVRLHPHNITQKIAIIIEHFRSYVRYMLDGSAKAMVVTNSRKEAVRYKIELDKYIKENKYSDTHVLVAFSGDVIDEEYASLARKLNLRDPFTEKNMNLGLKEEIPKAFDRASFQILVVANKFLTGFDQSKLCAMYIDKTLSGVDCVQTLSRLNRIHPGKDKITFILDFVNKAEDIAEAFSPFYKATLLNDNSDPNAIFAIKNHLIDARIFTLEQVEALANEYFSQEENIRNQKTSAITQKKLNSIIQNPTSLFKFRYRKAINEIHDTTERKKQIIQSSNQDGLKEIEKHLNSVKEEKAKLDKFKSGMNKFTDLYEFMTNIVEYDSDELEKLYVFLKFLKDLLKIEDLEEGITLTGLVLPHYRIHKYIYFFKASIE